MANLLRQCWPHPNLERCNLQRMMKLPVEEASETLFKQYTKLNVAELNGMLNSFEKSIVGKTLVNSGLLKAVKVPSKAFSTIKSLLRGRFSPS